MTFASPASSEPPDHTGYPDPSGERSASDSTLRISSLVHTVPPLWPEIRVSEVADLFLDPRFEPLLSLPVVSDGLPVGIISRYQMMQIFLTLYGRDLYGKRPIGSTMNPVPLRVDGSEPIESAAQYITEHMPFPVTEDFIVTVDGQYRGLGIVLDLLKAMERRVEHHNTELADAYRRLKGSQSRLIQSEKMASLGQMVAGVAHEINTPLGYIRNNVEVIEDVVRTAHDLLSAHHQLLEAQLSAVSELSTGFHAENDLEELMQLFQDTLYGVEQISELVINLKNFSRLDQAKVSKVSLNECVDSSLVVCRNILKNKAQVIKDYGDIPDVRRSPSQINQVFLNLLTNAAQAIEGQGKILIKTFSDGTHVHASVEDNGKGIPKQALRRIFDPFFTTKKIGEGTGLGLSISYQIIRQHQGRIRVASQVGRGTKFLISLPHRETAIQAVND